MNVHEVLEDYCLPLEEAKLSAKERNALPSSAFGLPKERKFPLHDKDHVMAAIKMFHHCPENKQAELRKNIKREAKKYDIDFE